MCALNLAEKGLYLWIFMSFFDVCIKKCEKVFIFQMAYDGFRFLYKYQPLNLRWKAGKYKKKRISEIGLNAHKDYKILLKKHFLVRKSHSQASEKIVMS